jgi:hypothetical protein
MPMVFRLRCLIAASTSGMALTIGKAEIASSSPMQKCPPIVVTAAALAPAAANHQVGKDFGLLLRVVVRAILGELT